MVPTPDGPPASTISRLLGALAALSAVVAAGVLLFPDPLADAFFAGWVTVGVGLALIGAVAAWTNRTPLVWTTALLLTGLAIAGMWSIGLFVAPAAIALLGASLFLQLASSRSNAQGAVPANPPTKREILHRAVAGTAFVIVGGSLVYLGAIGRELFSACASETLECAIDSLQWDAVGITVVGVSAVGIGGWVLWKQIYVSVLAASA